MASATKESNGVVNRVEGLVPVTPATKSTKLLKFADVYGVLQPKVSKPARPGRIETDKGNIKITLKAWPVEITEDGIRKAGCSAGASITLPQGEELTVDGITYNGKGTGTIEPENFMDVCNGLKALLQ